jgi:hypothetical protein
LEEIETSTTRKSLRLSDNDGGDDDSSDSQHEDTKEEEVSSEESTMNQVDTSEDKLVAKHGSGLFFADDRRSDAPQKCRPTTCTQTPTVATLTTSGCR